MNSAKQKLVESLTKRISDELSKRNPVKYLKKLDVDEITDIAITIIYLYTRAKRGSNKKAIMAEVISAIGHTIRNKNRLKRDSALAARSGAFVLYSFQDLGYLEVFRGQASNGHSTLLINVLSEEALCELWEKLPENKTEKLPSLEPYAEWVASKHETGVSIIKTNNKEVLESVTPETHPIVFEVVNKSQKVGWQINNDVYELHLWALRNKTEAFADIWEQVNPQAKETKLREARAIGDIARRFLDKTFYHLYYLDFRGRKYVATAYLHEQGSDLAKGLLLRADSKPIGEQGFWWLLISIANNWAGDSNRDDGIKTDKMPLNDRVYWVLDNEEIILDYAKNPKVNQGWMKADKPWQFLAAAIELKKFREWQEFMRLTHKDTPWETYGYSSHLEVYVDGSNNGSQHLSALTKDEITAPYVNLVPLEVPGDLYTYVAKFVWKELEKQESNLTKEQVRDCNKVIDTLLDMKSQIANSPARSERRNEILKEINDYRKEHESIVEIAASVFWNRIQDIKQRRKIVKRNIMTLPYGGTPYGLGQQQLDDAKKHGIQQLLGLEHRWGSFMGRTIYENCKMSLKRPMRLLEVFEKAGKLAEEENRFLSWKLPITDFPVTQHYVEGKVKKVYIQYGPQTGILENTGYDRNTLQLHICFIEDSVPSKRKQSQGASPNAIHSLDAAHLMLTVHKANFPITTVHDSFGCLLADMPDLFVILREAFVELYKTEPLDYLMQQIKGDISEIEIGNLNIENIIDSEYAFA